MVHLRLQVLIQYLKLRTTAAKSKQGFVAFQSSFLSSSFESLIKRSTFIPCLLLSGKSLAVMAENRFQKRNTTEKT